MRIALVAVVATVGCSSHGAPATQDSGFAIVTTGTHVVAETSIVGGLTSDGYIVFSDTDDGGHSVAKVIPLAGGTATTIATSVGTGKADIRFETIGTVVFAWTDRGDRMATLTMWTAATGAIALGSSIRPGRAGATPDGASILYERDITATTANVVAGPIAGTPQLVGSANTADSNCWQDTDLAATSSRLIARYCPDPATDFSLVAVTPDGAASTALSAAATTGVYRTSHIVWLESSGTLEVAAADGTNVHALAPNAADFEVSDDETTVAWLTTDGSIYVGPIEGGSSSVAVVGPLAKQLGALSPDNQTVLFASQVVDMGTGFVQPYTDVLAGRAGQDPIVLVPEPTSCPSCMVSSFTPDGQYILVLDPIDNSTAADGAGPIHAFATADGSSVATFGANVYNALPLAPGAGKFFVLDATPDTSLATSWAYDITIADVQLDDTVIAKGAEDFAIDLGTDTSAPLVVSSFAGSGDDAGIWVTTLQ